MVDLLDVGLWCDVDCLENAVKGPAGSSWKRLKRGELPSPDLRCGELQALCILHSAHLLVLSSSSHENTVASVATHGMLQNSLTVWTLELSFRTRLYSIVNQKVVLPELRFEYPDATPHSHARQGSVIAS